MKYWFNEDKSIRLYNDDCLEVMDKLIELGVKVDAIITDPPYATTQNKWDSMISLDEMWKRLNKLKRDDRTPIILFANEPFASMVRVSNIKQYKYDWCWRKDNSTGFLNAKRQPLRIYENIMVFYKKQCKYNPQMREGFQPYKTYTGAMTGSYGEFKKIPTESNGERYPINIIEFSRDSGKHHPTQKPIELMEYLIKTYTNDNDLILDFTMGSGTTGVACRCLNRRFIGIELNEDYFNIAVERIKNI